MNDIISAGVFLGAPAVLTARQRLYLEQWLGWLGKQNLDVVRLERQAYTQEPWRKLRELLSPADGVVLLGFRQLDAQSATWRPRTAEESSTSGWWTSPWLHLEAGMAIALGLPLLVVPEAGVDEGVFNSDAWNGPVHGSEIGSPANSATEWLELVRRHQVWRAAD